MKFLPMILILIGCAKESNSGHDGFEKYIAAFEKAGIENGFPSGSLSIPAIKLTDNFGPQGIAARCLRGSNEIEVNSYAWPHISEMRREMMIFHELGHCVLNKGHSSHSSLMHPNISITEDDYKNHRDKFIAELFQF